MWYAPLGRIVTGPPDICTCSLLPVRGAMSGVANVSAQLLLTLCTWWGRIGCIAVLQQQCIFGTRSMAVLCSAQCIDAQRRALVLEQRSDLRQNNWVSLEPLPSPWRAVHSPSTYYLAPRKLYNTSALYLPSGELYFILHWPCHLTPPDICAWSRGWRVVGQLALCCYFFKTDENVKYLVAAQAAHSWMRLTPTLGPRCENPNAK